MFQSVDEAFDYLHSKKNQMKYGLERMEWVLEKLHHPERRLKFIHIAGTNGKGSSAAMIASVLKKAGYDTGLFTSPYITEWNDEIQLNGQSISEHSFLRWLNHLMPIVKEMEAEGLDAPSYYEFWTLIAICYFAYETYPDFVVWETLLGGRLDATNVVHPIVSVITQIGMDHEDLLGDTIQAIAGEKAAIIKPGVPVICGAKNEDAQAVIIEQAKSNHSSLYIIDKDFHVKLHNQSPTESEFEFSNVFRTISDLKIRLTGRHQLDNVATVLMTLEVLRQYYAALIDIDDLREGLYQTVWPGRLEIVNHHPTILLDVAHNLDGIKALTEALNELYTYDRLILLTAMMKDKEVDQMLQQLLPMVDDAITTQVTNQPRSLSAKELSRKITEVQPGLSVQAFPEPENAIKHAKQLLNKNDLLLVTGSLYLLAEIRKFFV